MPQIAAAAVVFDLDGTLVDSEPIARAAAIAALRARGFVVDDTVLMTRFTGRRDDEMVATLAAEQGLGVDVEATVAAIDAVAIERLASELEPMPGAAELVPMLRHLPLAVASNSAPARVRLSLERIGLLQAFEPHVYSAALVPNGKPAPDIFLHAAAALGVAPERCVAIEDSVNGVAAAKAAGMTTIAVTAHGGDAPEHRRTLAVAGADHVVATLRAAVGLLV